MSIRRVVPDISSERVEVVYPLTNESWGVRRFYPNGVIINVMRHIRGAAVRE